ncbi:MAG: hypothetical protein HY320_16285 [Armatimonadetes bacterium]|nr:hypothetical protein [Armatimonadota bacterium]
MKGQRWMRPLWLVGAALCMAAISGPGRAQVPGIGGAPYGGPGVGGGVPFGGQPFGGPGFRSGQTPFQGGFLGSNTQGILLPGGAAISLAYCTDLFASPPDQTARYAPPADAGRVLLASGMGFSLPEAVQARVLIARGPGPMEQLPRDGWGALHILWVNQSHEPVALNVGAGILLTPEGASPMPAPHLPLLLSAAARLGIAASNVTQYAIWAARGATREDIEQTRLTVLSDEEVDLANRLLNVAGLTAAADSNQGEYARLYRVAEQMMGDSGQAFTGRALLNDGTPVRVMGKRDAEGDALLTLVPKGGGTRFLMGARLSPHKDGRWRARLVHLKTGRRLSGNYGSLIITPDAPRSQPVSG